MPCLILRLRMVILRPRMERNQTCRHTFGNGTIGRGFMIFFLKILLIARNVLIINTNWNGKMMKETN